MKSQPAGYSRLNPGARAARQEAGRTHGHRELKQGDVRALSGAVPAVDDGAAAARAGAEIDSTRNTSRVVNSDGANSQATAHGSCSARAEATEAPGRRNAGLSCRKAMCRQAPAPVARSAAMRSGVAMAWAVTSRVAMTTGRPAESTICSASGSHAALNSAEGVTLPSPQAPPSERTARSATPGPVPCQGPGRDSWPGRCRRS